MGAEALGVYSYTNSVAHIFFMLTMLGVLNYGSREIAAYREDKQLLGEKFSEIVWMQLLIGFVVIIFYTLYIVYLWIDGDNSNALAAILWLFYIVSGIIDISWFYWGIEQFSVTVLRNVLIKILTTIGIFCLVHKSGDIYIYISLISLSSLLSQGYLWVVIYKYVKFKKVTVKNIIYHIKPNFILFIPVVAVSFYTVINKILLGDLSSMEQLGYFDNVQKVYTLPLGLIIALGAVMLPRMANLLSNKRWDESMKYLLLSMQITNIMSIGFSFGLAAISPVFVVVYFGEDFLSCVELMEYYAISLVFVAWASVIRNQYLIPNKKDKTYIISVFVGAVVNIVTNIILIPLFYAIGAVISSIITEVVVSLVQTYYVYKSINIKSYFIQAVPFIIPGFIMFWCVRLTGTYWGETVITLIAELIVGALVYTIGVLVMLYFSQTLLGSIVREQFVRYFHGSKR